MKIALALALLPLVSLGMSLSVRAQQPLGTFCDAHVGACPCGDSTLQYESGCPNSYASIGANLHMVWSTENITAPSVSIGGYSLRVLNLPPNSTVVFCQATDVHAPTVFGDGMRCIGGSLIRIGTRPADEWSPGFWACEYPANVGTVPNPDPPLSVLGAIPPSGGYRGYQAIYRNAANFCTPSTFNSTNGWGVHWGS